jgi:hypothetical protein
LEVLGWRGAKGRGVNREVHSYAADNTIIKIVAVDASNVEGHEHKSTRGEGDVKEEERCTTICNTTLMCFSI